MDNSDSQGSIDSMNILFLSRKFPGMIGGLARFITELTRGFEPFALTRRIDLISVTDATLLVPGVILKTLLRTPLVVTAHGLDITWNHRLYQWVLRRLLPLADALVVDSAATRSLLDGYHSPKDRIHIINPGISIRHFSKKHSLSLPDMNGKTVLLTVGNLVPRKGHAWFIRHILPKLPSKVLYIVVGDGRERRAIEEAIRIRHLSHRVVLLGNITDEELSYLFCDVADIYVATNLHISHNFEGFGIAAGEAAAMGLPVIAHAVDGLPSVIHEKKNGMLIPPTIQAWRMALGTLTPAGRRNLGKKAKIYTRTHFSWKTTIRTYETVFGEVIRKTRVSPSRTSPK